jgi:hypothetical protein
MHMTPISLTSPAENRQRHDRVFWKSCLPSASDSAATSNLGSLAVELLGD